MKISIHYFDKILKTREQNEPTKRGKRETRPTQSIVSP